MQDMGGARRNRYGLGIAVFPTLCGPAWGHTGNVRGVGRRLEHARRLAQVVLAVNTYPLSPELEAAVRRLQIAASAARPSSPGWTRTNNPPVNSRMLCQLSYRGTALGRDGL